MNHKFSVGAAKDVGVNAAIVLWYVHAATEAAKALGDNCFDGRHWVRISVATLAEKYPYLSQGKVRLALRKLIDGGYVVAGNHSKIAYDNILLYALTDKGYELMRE